MPALRRKPNGTAISSRGRERSNWGAERLRGIFVLLAVRERTGTNPEELIAAAHAGCFSMAFANGLSKAGFPPTEVHTVAKVHLEQKDGGFRISRIELESDCVVPNIDEAAFQQQAESAKVNCPVSKVLAGAEISLLAKLRQ